LWVTYIRSTRGRGIQIPTAGSRAIQRRTRKDVRPLGNLRRPRKWEISASPTPQAQNGDPAGTALIRQVTIAVFLVTQPPVHIGSAIHDPLGLDRPDLIGPNSHQRSATADAFGVDLSLLVTDARVNQ
jgi:hypothetical protein